MLLPKKQEVFTNYHYGITGRIGDGGNTEVHYLQTSLRMKELDSIKLLVDIPGSEKWGIKDLFQRTINRKRITGPEGLISYFKDKDKVKYFNPIALVLLPMDGDTDFTRNVEKLKTDDHHEFEGSEGIAHTYHDVYQLSHQKLEDGNIGKIEWNSEKCYVVAIDGQHRLTALKEVFEESKMRPELAEIRDWQIPVVFLVLNKKIASGPNEKYISLIRKIFMYINMKAERVNDARAILLNDESIECLCVQEISSKIHENDTSDSEVNEKYPPLYLIDWIGTNRGSAMLANTRYLFSNLELRNWIRNYLIGEDFGADDRRADNLQIKRLDLKDSGIDFAQMEKNVLSYRDSEMIRNNFNYIIRDAFLGFLTQLIPIREYIKSCREFESMHSEDNTQMLVFAKLRYEYAKVENSNEEEFTEYFKDYHKKLIALKKDTMSDFFRQDICLRGFVFAYSEIYDIYKDYKRGPLDWDDYTETFMEAFNDLIESGWCEGYEDLDVEKKRYLTHICHDDTGKRINYKIEHVPNAWGIFVIMHVLKYSENHGIISSDCKNGQWGNYKDRLQSTLAKGFRDEVKREVDQMEKKESDKKRIIADRKEEMAAERLRELEILWGLD